MIVRSNKISSLDIRDAVFETPGIYFISFDYQTMRYFKPRGFERGYEFFCGGSSRRASAHNSEHKAATWVEWGIVIDRLYKIDPEARIGWYKNREDFMQKTADDYRIRHGEIKIEDCPWLVAA